MYILTCRGMSYQGVDSIMIIFGYDYVRKVFKVLKLACITSHGRATRLSSVMGIPHVVNSLFAKYKFPVCHIILGTLELGRHLEVLYVQLAVSFYL